MIDNPNAQPGSPIKTLAITAFAAALVFLFFGEHWVHLLGWLPFLLLLACPLLHMTMHGGHGGHGGPGKNAASGPEAPHQHNP
ncbi:MAG: DUF2933 domain-containing protein [Caulobacter sp.]|nr:DUF2933 domain-containing protein [Caulobacter sp.]